MDEDCRETLLRHTRCDEVMRCLELAGYKTREVLACIDNDLDTEVHLIEESVRRACIHMDEEARRPYIGLYARSPAEFRFPIGAKRALLLAVRELAQAARGTSDASTQTLPPLVDIAAANAWAHPQPPGAQMVTMPSGGATTPVSLPQLPLFATDQLPPGALSTPPPGTPLGTPTTSARVHFHPLYGMSPTTTTAIGSAFQDNNSGPQSSPHHLLLSNGGVSNGEADASIDMEKLKSNSTASVIRLSAKQYHDADLVEGRDFEVKIEVSTGEDGFKRATGIYCCHLCLGKRGEVSAVRFSIAKNRYPVVSNVMSHLKIHFVARLPPLPRTMIGQAAAAAAVAMTAASTGVGGQPVWPHVKQEASIWPTPPAAVKNNNEPWIGNAVWPSPQAVGPVAPDMGTDIASPTESTTEAASMDSNERC